MRDGRQFLDNPDKMRPGMQRNIKRSFSAVADGNDLVVIDGIGTGFQGFLDAFGLVSRTNNADRISMLQSIYSSATVSGYT